jgi:S1-C subfamily serine protease
LGLEVAPGVVVAEVLPETPAEAAGMAPGDIITEVGGVPVHTGLQLRELVLGSAAAGSLTVLGRRGSEEKVFDVTLNEEPQPAATA